MKIEKIIKPEQIILSATYHIKVEEIPKVIGPTFMKLVKHIKQSSAEIVSTPFVSYSNLLPDGGIVNKEVDIEIGMPIDKKIKGTDELITHTLESYKAVTALYVGAYEDMTPMYETLLEEIKKIGGTFQGKTYEYYLSDENVELSKQETIVEIPYK